MITVCKDCADRYIGCHSNCERFLHPKNGYKQAQAENRVLRLPRTAVRCEENQRP